MARQVVVSLGGAARTFDMSTLDVEDEFPAEAIAESMVAGVPRGWKEA